MEVKVGVQHVNREIVVETDASARDVETALSEAVSAQGMFTLTDQRGRKVIIPAAKIGYLDLGEEHARHVGFGTV